MAHLIYEENSVWIFVLATIVLGGGAALLTGRAIAAAWRPWWHVITFMLLLSAAVRFLHFALFGGTLLSLHYYAADTAVCLVLGLIGFRLMRVTQMVTSYGWINERAAVHAWRRRGTGSSGAEAPKSG
jgi:uncharacterized protein DUF6867